MADEQDEEAFLATQVMADLVLAGRGGGRKARREVDFRVVRALTEEDIPLLVAPPPLPAGMSRQVQMRHSHHQLAQNLAKGMDDTEASLVTGYSTNYISILRTDPAFQELLANYGAERQAVFVDVLERMKSLGLHTLEELQGRLETDPEKFSNREMMELAKMLLVDGGHAGRAGQGTASGGSGPVQVAISFVTATQQPQASGPVLDGITLEGGEL